MTREEAIRIIKIVLAVAEDFEIIVQGEEFTEEKCKEAVEIVTETLSSLDKPNKSEIPTGWIPCEKRLPDKLQDVLITFYDADGEYDVAYMRKTFNATYKAQGSENEWVSSMGETTYADYEVSAWMPIEPYMASPTGAESEG